MKEILIVLPALLLFPITYLYGRMIIAIENSKLKYKHTIIFCIFIFSLVILIGILVYVRKNFSSFAL